MNRLIFLIKNLKKNVIELSDHFSYKFSEIWDKKNLFSTRSYACLYCSL